MRTVWSDASVADRAASGPIAVPVQSTKSASSVEDKSVFAGRSVYYGSFLFWSFVAGGLWLSVLLQAALVGAAVFCALRLLVHRPITSTAGCLVALGVATPLSWFSSYLMPDVFAGLGLVAAALLLTHFEQMRRWETGFWLALLAFALAAHTSHLAMAGILLAMAVLARLWWRRSLHTTGIVVVAGAIGVALLADMIFGFAVTRATGAAPVRPPMLTARVMHSETGRASLRKLCPTHGYAVCAFVERPSMTANDFLWNPNPSIGVFTHADPATRRALSDEQMRVFVAAFLDQPLATTRELLVRWGRLMSVTEVPEFNHAPADRAYFSAKLPPSILEVFMATPSAQGRLPLAPLQSLFLIAALGSLLFAARCMRDDDRMIDFALLLLVGVLANAAVCSALSGVEPRYQTRMIWLLPFLAVILGLRRQTFAGSTRSARQSRATAAA